MLGHREMDLKDYMGILQRRWPLIVALVVLGGGSGFAVLHFVPKRYTSQTVVLVQQPTVPDDYVKPVVSDATGARLASMQQEIMSRSRLEPVIRQLGLFPESINQEPMGDLVARLQSAITVTPVVAMADTRANGLPGFNVSVTFEDPRQAQQICSSITSLFIGENQQLHQQQAEETTDFIAKQLDGAKAKLDEQDAKLADFQRRNMGTLPDDTGTNLNVLSGLNSQLEAGTETLARERQDKTFQESVLTQQVAAWQALHSGNGNNAETNEERLAALQDQLTALKSKYTDDYPDVIKTKNDIATLTKAIAQADAQRKTTGADKPAVAALEPAQIQTLRAQIRQIDENIKQGEAKQAEIQERINKYQARVESIPAVDQQYKQLTRDYQTALEFYNGLLKERDQSAMATDLEKRQQGEQFRILDAANLPDAPSYPKKSTFLLGGFGGGLALGLALTLLLEMQDASFRNEKDVEAVLRMPVLAMIPAIKPPGGKETFAQ